MSTADQHDDPTTSPTIPAPLDAVGVEDADGGPELADAVRSLRSVILAGEHYRLAVATHLGISVNESQAISYLFAEGPLGQTDLAQRMNLTTSTVTGLLDRLERRGLTQRVPDPHDRRRSTVHLSERGHGELNEVRGWMTHAFGSFDRTQLTRLATDLKALADGLRGFTEVVATADSPYEPPRRRL